MADNLHRDCQPPDAEKSGSRCLLLHTEPVHGAAYEATLVERATHLEHIALNLHRAVVGLAVTWIIDGATAVLVASLFKAAEHVEPDELARAQLGVGVLVIHSR